MSRPITFALLLTLTFAVCGTAVGASYLDAPTYLGDTLPYWITTADFNHDGFPDVAAGGAGLSGGAMVSIFLNHGDGTFGSPADYPVPGIRLAFITQADVNNDGNPDLLVINLSDGGKERFVYLLLGNGDGTFQPATPIAVGRQPYFIATGDFNHDGNVDIAVANLIPDGTVSILLGNGDGTFQSPVAYAAGVSTDAVVTGDFDGDGILDLATLSPNNATVCIFHGNGDGTFLKESTYPVGTDPSDLAVADFNNDGKLDLVVANDQETDVSILLGNGNGTFQPQTKVNLGVGMDAFSVAVGDFNHDGNMDLVVGATDLRLLLGRGDGTFEAPVGYTAGVLTFALADFNGDGNLDVGALGGNGTIGGISVLLGDGAGDLRDARDFIAGYGISSLAAGDFNGDGKLDLVTANILDPKADIALLTGKGDGSFNNRVTIAVPTGSLWLAVADFNLDGKLDVVVAGNPKVSVLLGNGDGTFQPPIASQAGGTIIFLAVGDFNGDGKPDIAILNMGAQTFGVMLGNGDGTFQAPSSFNIFGQNPLTLAVGDFNEDSKLDVAISGSGGNMIWLGNGDGTFQQAGTYSGGYGPIITADFNHDGKLDLAVADNASNAIAVFLGNGDGTFQAAVDYAVSEPSFLVALDVNGDGRLDLAVTSGRNQFFAILLGNGDGTFQTPVSFAASSPDNLTVGDFNGDHAPDLVLSGIFDYVTSFLNTGGTFPITTSSQNPSKFGQAVTFTATVTPTYSFIGTPTGTVTFKDGTKVLGRMTLSGGQASLTTSGLSFGKHRISAIYSGDANFNPNSALILKQKVTH